ncbi:multiple epidermal growth factor-like domains protein 10 [Saccostrea cucullata]|uniref:multiple epidermal growth factor-like domains protein 10 n=1 Tax=Saccostrea cuccullata TaxID=36930 RepID=UPI002ED2EFE1
MIHMFQIRENNRMCTFSYILHLVLNILNNFISYFTVCPDGTYGSECKSVCSEGCLSVCDKKNGTCEKCREGYTGAFCIDAHALQRRMTSIVEVAGITTSIACFSILFALVLKRERLAAM